jgi:hypothetical protein
MNNQLPPKKLCCSAKKYLTNSIFNLLWENRARKPESAGFLIYTNHSSWRGGKMDQKQLFKQMLDFQKTTFDNSFNAMVLLQEQTEKASVTLLDQATWLPEEGRKAIDEWIAAYKKGREEYKTLVDENFSKVEEFFAG